MFYPNFQDKVLDTFVRGLNENLVSIFMVLNPTTLSNSLNASLKLGARIQQATK